MESIKWKNEVEIWFQGTGQKDMILFSTSIKIFKVHHHQTTLKYSKKKNCTILSFCLPVFIQFLFWLISLVLNVSVISLKGMRLFSICQRKQKDGTRCSEVKCVFLVIFWIFSFFFLLTWYFTLTTINWYLKILN